MEHGDVGTILLPSEESTKAFELEKSWMDLKTGAVIEKNLLKTAND